MRSSLKDREDAFGEVSRFRISYYVRKHVQAAAVSHSHVDLFYAACRGTLHQLIEHRDDGFTAFKRKSLLTQIFLVKELFELLCLDQLLQKLEPGFTRQRLGINKVLPHLGPDPILFDLALNVPVFNANLAAICLTKDIEDAAKRRGLFPVQPSRNKFSVEIPDRQAKLLEIEFRRVMGCHIQRVNVRKEVSANAVGIDKLQHVRLLFSPLGKAVAADQRRVKIRAQRSGLKLISRSLKI